MEYTCDRIELTDEIVRIEDTDWRVYHVMFEDIILERSLCGLEETVEDIILQTGIEIGVSKWIID